MLQKACSLIFSTPLPTEQFLALGYGRPRFLLPYAGRFTYLDLALSSLWHAGVRRQLVVAGEGSWPEDVHAYMEAAWGEDGWAVLPVPELSEAPFDKDMLSALKGELKSWVFLFQADHPCWLDLAAIDKALRFRTRLVQPVIDKKPAPALLVERGMLVDMLQEALRRRIAVGQVLPWVFQELARSSKVENAAVEGHLRRIDHVDQYVAANLDVLRERPAFEQLYRRVPVLSGLSDRSQAVIESDGEVSYSLLSDRCQVRGRVVRSVLFPGAVVGRGAVVEDSILLPGVVVADDAVLTRCVVDGGGALPQNVKAHVGAESRVGHGKASARANEPYGAVLGRGWTLVGPGAIVPAGVTVGANCFLAPGVGRAQFRRAKNISDGRTLTGARS